MARCSFVPELDQLVSMATFPIGKQMAGKVFKKMQLDQMLLGTPKTSLVLHFTESRLITWC